MEIQFRQARPGDVHQAVPLIYSSGPTIFDYLFTHKSTGSPQKYLHSAFMQGVGQHGFQTHTVATVAGQVVGVGSCFSGKEALGFTLATGRQIFSIFGPLHCWNIMYKGLRVEQILPPPKGETHYIAQLGIAPEWRGQGIGTQLLENLLEQGRTAQRKVAALDVAVDNPRAQALYERLGFVVIRERKSTLANAYGKVGDYRRMEKRL